MATRMPFIIEPMRLEDIPAVIRIEQASFPTPWSEMGYRRELTQNKSARYFVLRSLGDESLHSKRSTWLPDRLRRHVHNERQVGVVIGYGGYWLMTEEAHITTIAIVTSQRGRGLGEWLFLHLLADAIAREADRVTLEVRPSNVPARTLYEKYGFKAIKYRRHYYADGEDALFMLRSNVQSQEFQQWLRTQRTRIDATLPHGRETKRN